MLQLCGNPLAMCISWCRGRNSIPLSKDEWIKYLNSDFFWTKFCYWRNTADFSHSANISIEKKINNWIIPTVLLCIGLTKSYGVYEVCPLYFFRVLIKYKLTQFTHYTHTTIYTSTTQKLDSNICTKPRRWTHRRTRGIRLKGINSWWGSVEPGVQTLVCGCQWLGLPPGAAAHPEVCPLLFHHGK
jgi:hypothetical protein